MDDHGMEALKLVGDWAKWLVTIETGAIAIIGATAAQISGGRRARTIGMFATLSVASFIVSIAGAAFLLLSLPEIAQTRDSRVNVWPTQDSYIGTVLGANRQTLAIVESVFFGVGVVMFAAMVAARIWNSHTP
jgi:hypothetical protein